MGKSGLAVALVVGVVSAAAMAAGPSRGGKQLECWTDKSGARACGDHVPPEYAKQQRDVLNNSGQVVSTKARELTDAERAEAQRQAEAAVAEQRRRTRQVAYDNFMMQSYESVTQLQKVRDENLKTIDSRQALAEKAVPGAEAALKAARARAQADADKDTKDKIVQEDTSTCRDPQELKDKLAARAPKGPPPKKGKAPPPPPENKELKEMVAKWESRECGNVRRAKQVGLFEQGLVDTLKAVQSLKKSREDTTARFEHDIIRFKKLKAREIMPGTADPDGVLPGAPVAAAAAPVSP